MMAAVSGLLLALCSFAWAAAPAPTPVSPQVLRDESFCQGCHEAGTHAAKAPIIDAQVLHDSAHSTLTCVDCHRDIDATPHRTPIEKVDCGSCHSEAGVQRFLTPEGETATGLSFHATFKQKGVKGRPVCTQCHGDHSIQRVAADTSRLGRRNVSTTCGSCHRKEASEYLDSVHGKALRAGNRDVPTCDTCHPEHPRALRLGIAQRGVVATCVSCHEDPGLQARYALPGNRLASYLGSYHGAAAELGDSRTANCASCHGKHLILPSTDPRSTVNAANLPKTCGDCHPGAGKHFAEGKVHLQPSMKRDRLVFAVKVGYQLFIGGLMSGFVGYIGLDLFSRVRRRNNRAERRHSGDEREFERLSLHQRIQHWCLITSFVTLMVTGLPLASPRWAISQGVISFLGGMGARAVIHRVAAVALIGLVIHHGLYVLFARKGYQEFRELLPGPRDGTELIQMLKYYFGLSPVRAKFGRYNYIEKFEYLAVGWGSVVMIATGAMLWAPRVSMLFLPKWAMDIAFIIHSWEAILAFLAIIIWHMYNVHWNPSIFPMSKVWLTGRIGLQELRENHPREYERYLQQMAAESEPE